MANKKSIGLPGGPNEYITDISEYISVEGYKFNSSDVDNPFNIINSGSITMEDVEFPVLGTDNLGNSQMMQPGMNYEFPGDMVFEIPMAQEGDETVQTEFKIDDRSGKINTTKGYDENKLFEFIKDKYKKVDTSTQKNDLVNKLSTPAFRERYKKNIFNISGENLSDEELTSRINSQIDFTAAGPDFHIKMPFVTHGQDKGYMRGSTPFIEPFFNRQKLSYQGNQGLYQANIPEIFGDITDPDFPELTKYPYIVQLGDKRQSGIMGDRDVLPYDAEGSTIVHEYAHSYNTPFSPLFKPVGEGDKYGDGVINPNAYYETDRGNYNSEKEKYDYSGSYEEIPGKRYKNWLSNLFGEDYFTDTKEAQPYSNWAMKPWEVSSIRAQTEDKLKNANIWDNTKGEFNESNLNKMLRSDRYNSEGPETMHLDKLGYNELERINYNKKQINRKQERFNSGIDGNSSNYIMNNIIDTDGNRPVMKIDDFNIIFNNSQSSLRDNQKYSDFTSLVNDSKVGSRGKKKRANELLNKIYSDVKNELNQGYEAEKIELQKNFDIKKKEVLPKMKMYFNEIAMDDVDQVEMAQYGNNERRPPQDTRKFMLSEYDKPGFFENIGDVLANPVTAFGYTARGENIPDRLNVGSSERNNFDMAVDIFNPFSWYQYGENSWDSFKEGNILDGTLNALGVLPFIPASLASIKKLKAFSRLKDINKIKEINKVRDANKIIKPSVTSRVDDVVDAADDYFTRNVSSIGDNTPDITPIEKRKLQKIIDKNIAYVKSNEYLRNRMTNTGETKQEILDQVADYIADFKKMPINFYSWGDDALEGIKGSYSHPINVKNKGAITMGRGPGQLDNSVYDVFDHEVKHALSPSGKYNKQSANYLDALREIDELDEINKIFEATTTSKAADEAINLYKSVVPAGKVPKVDQGATSVYRNYPRLSIYDNNSNFDYMNSAPEQQVRLLRAGDWLKKTFGWDGTKAGLSDEVLEKIPDMLRNNKGNIPADVKELLRSSGSSASHFRDVVSQAWSVVPAGLGAGVLSQQKKGGGLPKAQWGTLGKALGKIYQKNRSWMDKIPEKARQFAYPFNKDIAKTKNFDDLINLPDDEFAKFSDVSKDHWKLIQKRSPEYKDRLIKQYNGMFKPNDNVMPAIEKTQKEMATFFNSPEYKQRLVNGLNISTKEADDIVSNMIKQINETKFTFNNVGSDKYGALATGPLTKFDKAKITFTDVVNNTSPEQLDGLIRHELGHVGSYLKAGNNKFLSEQFPKLDLQESTIKTWSKNNKDLIDYYSTPDEIRQRGLVALDFIKKNNITIDDFLNISYDKIVTGKMQRKIPSEILDLRQYYKPEQLGPYLKKMFSVVGTLGLGDQLTKEQDGGTTPSRSQIIISEDNQNRKDNQVLGLTNIIDYMVDSRGGNEKTWTDLADNIAFHESGPEQRMNPQARQITKDGKKDGLGRGMFQFEPESFETAKIRYKNVANAVGYKLDENILNAGSALDLSPKDQYTLFFANLIESPAVLKDYADGKSSMADVWLKGHKNVSKKGNRKSFANSIEAAKKELGKRGFLQFSLEDLLPYKKGGESDMLDTYKNYINGKVKSQEATNVYDKLNRIHLNDARRMGMTVPNYIMTHL